MEFWGYTLLVATQLLLLNRIVLGQFLGSALSSITSHNGLIFFLEEHSFVRIFSMAIWVVEVSSKGYKSFDSLSLHQF